MKETQPHTTSLVGLLLRLYWMVGGACAAILSLVLVVRDDLAMDSSVSLLFWGLLALMIVARYLDVSRFHGLRSDALTLATMGDVRGYAVGVLVGGGPVWTAAHFI